MTHAHQADLNLRLAHMTEGTFSDVAAHISSLIVLSDSECDEKMILMAYANSESLTEFLFLQTQIQLNH